MSYVPYDPNVWPAEPVDDSKSQRAARVAKWAWGSGLYLIAIAAWVIWMKMPPKLQPPFALIPLADGTELTDASDYPVGNPENPVTTHHLEEKFTALVAPRLGADAAHHAIGAIRVLEHAPDMADVFRDFASARTA